VTKADDATILYETDPIQILLNKNSAIFQAYPSILELADRMSMERTGYGTYEFLDVSHNKTIDKGSYWTTILNKGTEMRVIITLALD
jgi:hypothetical protein